MPTTLQYVQYYKSSTTGLVIGSKDWDTGLALQKAGYAPIGDETRVSQPGATIITSPSQIPLTTIRPPQPPTPTLGNLTGQLPGVTTEGAWEEEPGAYYRGAMGIPAMGLTPAQQWLRRQAQPAYAQYQATSRLYPEFTEPTWGGFLSQGLGGIRAGAPLVFSKAAGLAPQQQRSWLEDIGGMDALQDLMQNVLRQAYAAPVARRMAARLPELQEAFTTQYGPEYAAGGAGGEASFLDYIRKMYNLRY